MNKFNKYVAIFVALLLSATPALSKSDAISTQIEIDGIEFSGVKVLTQAELENTLEISPGDLLERIKVVRTAENIQEAYRKKGYEQVTITSRLFSRKIDKEEKAKKESILEFNISEGKPTRIASIHFSTDQLGSTFQSPDFAKKVWQEFQVIFVRSFGLSPGDILEQDKVAAGKRVIQDLLASKEFIGAKMDEPRISVVDAPSQTAFGLDSSAYAGTGRWVHLEVPVHLGEKVTFGFRGNHTLTQNQLSTLIEEQRVLGFTKDYVTTIQSKIEEEYRSLGFAKIKITAFGYEKATRRERHVTFQIEEGPRIRIHRIDFEGNTYFKSSQLLTLFKEQSSPLLQHGYYYEKDAKNASDSLVEWMKSKGFLSARILSIKTIEYQLPDNRKDRNQVDLIIYLDEFEQTLVESIHFEGLRELSNAQAIFYLGVKEAAPIDLAQFSRGIETLKTTYRNLGYLEMVVVNEGTQEIIAYSNDNRSAKIFLRINEGPRFRVSKITLDGFLQTQGGVIQRELAFREGEILGEDLILQTESRLRKLGIFSSVNIKVSEDPEKKDHKTVRVTCHEEIPGLVGGGVGFRNDLGIRGFSEISYGNLWGKNHTVAFALSANRRFEEDSLSLSQPNLLRPRFIEYNAELFYLWPWFGINELLFRPSFSVSKRIYNLFSAQTTSISLTWEKPILKRPKLLGSFSYSLEKINQFDAESFEDEGDFRIGSITPSVSLDLRDQALSPTSGFYLLASQEIAAPVLYSQGEPKPVGYTRFQLRSDYYIPIAKETSFQFSFRTGFERNLSTVSAKGIPTIKQFSLGGVGSIRGFNEHELNYFKKAILGTLSYVNYRTQLDMPFAGPMRFGPFIDAANLILDDFSFLGQLRFGTGFGLHYQTPVGPINFDVGFKINPRPNEDSTKVYFSVGLI